MILLINRRYMGIYALTFPSGAHQEFSNLLVSKAHNRKWKQHNPAMIKLPAVEVLDQSP